MMEDDSDCIKCGNKYSKYCFCDKCFEEEKNKARQQGAKKMLYTIEHFFVIQTKNKFDYKEIHEFLEQLKKGD